MDIYYRVDSPPDLSEDDIDSNETIPQTETLHIQDSTGGAGTSSTIRTAEVNGFSILAEGKQQRPPTIRDRRLQEVKQNIDKAENNNPVISEPVKPVQCKTDEDLNNICSMYRGIQGHHNSCYLDATLFSMFMFTSVFDHLINRPKAENDIKDYKEVQRILREEIVHPLRSNLFVKADRVMPLRNYLDTLSSGWTSEEKDPEELISSLLDSILKAEPLLKMNSGHDTNCYQVFVDKDQRLTVPTVQQLFEQSFHSNKIKLRETPKCLIIQMPRFGKKFKMYQRIIPSELLDITEMVEKSPRLCRLCGELATYECDSCNTSSNNSSSSDTVDIHDGGFETNVFCRPCAATFHKHELRDNHKPRPLELQETNTDIPHRVLMRLFAVVCIETSHYVAFAKCGTDLDAPWCFFDSMADREGERDGINIPAIVACTDVSRWLSDKENCQILHKDNPSDRSLPEHARRMLCDAYICMYQKYDDTNI